ncbi:hypothetical protein [Kribbella sp. NPDC000426]|uniref:hypothetical protein n=1 Tax=Kribbella sp. NPDC000426 TaxID=3154255 RepID=UPI0033217BB7
MRDSQGIVNLMLVVVLGLIPVALVTLIVGRWRSQRFVLKWAQAAGVLSTALATGYVVTGAACLILEGRTPAATYPLFLLPVGGIALAVSLAILGVTVRSRWRMG